MFLSVLVDGVRKKVAKVLVLSDRLKLRSCPRGEESECVWYWCAITSFFIVTVGLKRWRENPNEIMDRVKRSVVKACTICRMAA
jgi:hypothetical protein